MKRGGPPPSNVRTAPFLIVITRRSHLPFSYVDDTTWSPLGVNLGDAYAPSFGIRKTSRLVARSLSQIPGARPRSDRYTRREPFEEKDGNMLWETFDVTAVKGPRTRPVSIS